jgi:MoaA/NifB/PqqE/SkfB family radical SAM enzyme
MKRLKVIDDAPPAAPSRVALISLTTFCNAQCRFCCVLDILNKPELNPSDEAIFARIAAARAEGCTTLGFTGGEPTVHPRFAEFCRRGRELGFEAITINTNGIKFKSARWTEEVLAAGLSHVDFSIHGDDAALHDAMMDRDGAFEAFQRGMANIRSLQDRYPVVLGATTVVTSRNALRLPRIAAMLLDEGIRSLRFKHCFEGGDGADLAMVGRYTEQMPAVREAVRLARRRGAGVQVTHFPLCMLDEELLFASDLMEESVLSIDRDGSVLMEGRVSNYRREGARSCEGCAFADACTRLDHRYVAVHGESELRPVAGRGALERVLDRALDAYPGEPCRGTARRFLAAHRARSLTTKDEARTMSDRPTPAPNSIGFISPTFRVLEVNWQHDYEMVKLGVPTLMGHLYRLGYRDLRQWDFDAQICEACADDPDAFDLRAYFDAARVRGFLDGTDDTLRPQTEKLLAVLGVEEMAVFGISLSAVLDRIVNVMALAAVGQCVAKVLKERYPRSYVVLGGIQASPDDTHPRLYKQIMAECPAIDAAFCGHTGAETVLMLRNFWARTPEKNRGLSDRIIYRDDDGVPQQSAAGPAGTDHLPEDVRTLQGLRKGLAVHTKSGAAAINAAEEGERCGTEEPAVVAPAALLRKSQDLDGRRLVPAPAGSLAADFERTDLSGPEAGAHAYETIPAAVPYFDPSLVDHFRYSGFQIMKRFHFDKEAMLRFSRYENEQIVVLPHIFVRGCNAPCGFCTYAYSKIEGEEVEQTVAGLQFLAEHYDCRHFHFLNTQINSVYGYAERFCDQVIAAKLDILWSDCCNMRALDERLLEKMRRSGAMRLVFGVESPEDSMLKMIHKGINTETIERLLKASHDLGIWNHVLLIAGMPHETRAKQDRIMDFLERTAPLVDFYSVSSYYLINSSPWGKSPEKYGIERISDPSRYLEEQAFNELRTDRWESDGLQWPQKKQQIVESTQRMYKTISRAKGQSRCVAGNIDLYLLMFLYRVLGHDRKAEIAKIYVDTAKEIFPDQRPVPEEGVPRNRFRVSVPYVVGRMNEGDQSMLVQVPVDFVIAPRESGSGFCNTPRYAVSWRSPAAAEGAEGHHELEDIKRVLPEIIAPLVKMLSPFLQALDTRLAPTTPERMAELVALNLARYRPFLNEGYTVTGPATQRTHIERTLEWSGVSN